MPPSLIEITATAIRTALDSHEWRLRPTAVALDVSPGRLRRLISECGLDAEYGNRNPGPGNPGKPDDK